MHLAPIEQPKSMYMKIAYQVAKRIYGKVVTPMKVVYARNPALLGPSRAIGHVMEKKLSLSPTLRNLIAVQGSLLNGCEFCKDLTLAQAMRAKVGVERFKHLANFKASAEFSAAEKAMLAYTEAVTREKHASPEIMAELKKHFSDREIVDITWMNAAATYFNMMSAGLDLASDDLVALV